MPQDQITEAERRRGQRFAPRAEDLRVFDTPEEADAFILSHSRQLNQVCAALSLPPLYPEVQEENHADQ